MRQLISLLFFFLSFQSLAQPNDCADAVPGCTTPSFTIEPNNPSTNIVDFTSGSISNPSTNPNAIPGNSGCLLSGETSSTFITISVVTTGTLEWSIIGPSGGCFDWIMWPYQNSTVTCSGISGNTLAPVACNWNGMCNGNTGMAPAGQLPPDGDQSSYEAPLNVTAGQQYLLCLSNYSGTSQNVNLNFFGSANVACGVSSPDQTICIGGSALVTIATPGVNAPQFNWLVTDGVSNTSSGTGVTVTPTVTTTYEVEVYQPATGTSSEFRDTAVFTIYVQEPPTPDAGVDDTVCLGQPIQLIGSAPEVGNSLTWSYLATGVTPVPTVTFAPGVTSQSPSVNVNQPGLYRFILTESNPICGLTRDTVAIFVSSVTHTLAATSPSCPGLSDGSITIISPTGIEFSLDNGATWQSSNTFTGLNAGNYTVCSKNAEGCLNCSPITVVNPPNVLLTVSNDTTICQNGSATLIATANGGNTITYHWDHTSSNSSLQSVQPSNNTVYNVYASNENGCNSSTEQISVNVLGPITGTISPDTYVCPGYSTFIAATGTGGIGAPYTFYWSSGTSGVGSSDSVSVSPNQTMTYTVSISDACESTPLVLDVEVQVAPLPDPAISIDEEGKCEPAVFLITSTTDPTMVDHLTWNISNGDSFQDMESVSTSSLDAGSYDVQLIVESPLGCIDSATFSAFLTVYPKPIVDFTHSPNPAYLYDPTIQFFNTTTYGDSYQWFFESGNPEFSNLENPISAFPEGEVGTYDVTLIATSEYGCLDTLTKQVLVVQDVVLFVPNTFTPDGNEFNQDFGIYIDGIDSYSFSMTIYDRWGDIIWENDDPLSSWDGSYKGRIVQSGTYIWKITAKDKINDNQYVWHGYLNVLH
jgi:gliding motility-associated-like protein